MSADGPAAAASPPPTADPQDPLPESNWKWRRIFIFLSSGIAVAGVAAVLWMLFAVVKNDLEGRQDVRTTLSTVEALYNLGWWILILLLVDRVLYLIAPSAEQAAKMLATVSAWKSGISTASAARSSAPDGSTAEASTHAGPATSIPAAPASPSAPAPVSGNGDALPEYAR